MGRSQLEIEFFSTETAARDAMTALDALVQERIHARTKARAARDYATAETAFKTALKSPTEQKNLELWLALGVAQRGLKKYKDAETSYNQAVKLNAGDPRAFFNLGVLYQDHIAVQVDDLDEVSKLKPEYPGWMLERQGGERTSNLS